MMNYIFEIYSLRFFLPLWRVNDNIVFGELRHSNRFSLTVFNTSIEFKIVFQKS